MTIETRLAEIRARADESAVEEMGGCVLPTEIGMRAAFEWLAIQEGVRPDWYLEEVPTILAGIDAARRLLAAERAMAAALTDVLDLLDKVADEDEITTLADGVHVPVYLVRAAITDALEVQG